MHEVAVLPDKEVVAMSRSFQTPDVTQLRVKHAKGMSTARVFSC